MVRVCIKEGGKRQATHEPEMVGSHKIKGKKQRVIPSESAAHVCVKVRARQSSHCVPASASTHRRPPPKRRKEDDRLRFRTERDKVMLSKRVSGDSMREQPAEKSILSEKKEW